jgi:hypothetical protein
VPEAELSLQLQNPMNHQDDENAERDDLKSRHKGGSHKTAKNKRATGNVGQMPGSTFSHQESTKCDRQEKEEGL